jgi:DNA-binding CsgD family transcriptional regulator
VKHTTSLGSGMLALGGRAGSAQPWLVQDECCRSIPRFMPPPQRSHSLTSREIECLCWCAEGKSYWETGSILGISERTVSFHMERVRSKLRAGNNAHAVALAYRSGALSH